jgi:molybdopterin-guanine dinucleotide biosynthesis protein A
LFRGRPLIEWTLEALRPQAGEILISANRNLESYARLGTRLVEDRTDLPWQGPFAGLVRLLESAAAEWLLCVPCDAVFLPPDLGARFADCVEREQADVAVLADAQGIHPTFCYLRTALAEDARRCFDAGERAPRRWFARQRMARMQGATPINLNTPESLAGLELRGEPASRS